MLQAHEAQIPTLQEALAEKSSVATQRQVLLTGLHQQLAEKSAQVLRLNGDLTLAKDAYNTAALVWFLQASTSSQFLVLCS